jgi:hypothetical protein
LSADAVAGDPWLIMDDRNTAPDNAVEKSGFADVRWPTIAINQTCI